MTDAEGRRRSAEIALGRLMHGKLQAIEPLNPGAEEQGAATAKLVRIMMKGGLQ